MPFRHNKAVSGGDREAVVEGYRVGIFQDDPGVIQIAERTRANIKVFF